jgi:hypothetical protein
MKDAVTGDTPRTGGSNPRPGDFRMGQPVPGNAGTLSAEYIGRAGQTEGSEPSQYLQEKKAIAISLVVASEREIA